MQMLIIKKYTCCSDDSVQDEEIGVQFFTAQQPSATVFIYLYIFISLSFTYPNIHSSPVFNCLVTVPTL